MTQSSSLAMQFLKKAGQLATAGLAVLSTFPSPALHAIGFRVPGQDSFVVARGTAFAATADSPAALHYNPAGITQLSGTHVSSGVSFVNVRTRYRSPEGTTTKNKNEYHPVPHFFATHRSEGSRFAYGVGITAPFGLSNEWPDDVRFRDRALEGGITYISALPTVAYQITPTLSAAAGLSVNFADAELVSGTGGFGAPGGKATFEGDDYTLGYHLSLFWQPHEQHAFGINFRSHDTLHLRGSFDLDLPAPLPSGSQNAKADFPIPEFLIVGYSYRPTPNWNFEINLDWTRWSRLGNVTLEYPTGPGQLRFNWESSIMYQFGVTRFFQNGYRVSGGYVFSENSVPTQDFTPLTADADRHLLSIGVGRTYDRLSWDIAAQYGYSSERDIPASQEPATGSYKTRTLAFTGTIQYAF